MPEIQAFRGIRYDLGHVGSLSDVVSPPYDVISPELQNQLYDRHPCNFVRLELNRMAPDDDEANNRYTRAARFLKQWRSEGVLFQEADPAIYVYHQQFTVAGRRLTRRGFMARMRISPFGEGQVFPHEQTMLGPKLDRLMLTVVCKANLSQIFGLFPDPGMEVYDLLDRAVGDRIPLEATDHLGVVHRMWPVTEASLFTEVAAKIGPKPIFIADGHHRYETACKYRREVYDSGFLSPEHPANYVLMTYVAMDDPGLIVLPTHRLFRNVADMTSEELAGKLGDAFATRPLGDGPAAANGVWEELDTGDRQDALGFYTRKDGKWTLAELTASGREKLAALATDHGPQWQGLGVSILHRLVVENLLGGNAGTDIKYVHLVDEVVAGLEANEFPLAAMVMPATVEHIRTISMTGERMPAKSTYFYPKLIGGLVINPLQ